MMHQFRDKKYRIKRKNIIRTSIWLGLFLVCGGLGVWSSMSGLFMHIGRPLWNIQQRILNTAHTSQYLIRTKASVFHENDVLKQENAEMKASMVDYKILEQENNALKELLGRLPEKYDFVLGTILVKPNHSPYDTIIIDIGENRGIREGNTVFANGHIPIGEISKVYATTALVALYSNPGQTTNAVLESVHASVDLLGRGGGNFEMNIPIDLSAEKGAQVVLSGLSAEVIAVVEYTISSPTDPLKKVLLRSPVNVQSLKWVEVKKS